MADSSFDIVSKIDRQEADNALNQARKELEQRYDFKGTGVSIEWSGEAVLIKANSEERATAALDVFQTKLIKRGISLKSLDSGEPQASGKEFRIVSTGSLRRTRRRSARSSATRGRSRSSRRSRATNCACSRRAATTCRRCSACSRPPTSTSICSS